MKSLNGSVTIIRPKAAVSSRNSPAQNHVAPWKKRCRPGWSFSLSATTSAASCVTRGLRVGAVRANTTHIARLAIGNCNSNIHR